MNIERKATLEGDAFFEHQTHILDHEGKENILKHMGFSLNRTHAFWPSVLTIGFLYILIILGCSYLYRTDYFLPLFNIKYQKNKAFYVNSLIVVSPLLGFFGYLFLASFLIPLQPSLENLWFVSFWWPLFSFVAIFITPLIAYWPLKTRLSNLFSYNFDDFFPIFSFLAFFGSSLHLISNFFFVYHGWELIGIILTVLTFIAILTTFMHSRKSYAALVSAIILLLFAFLSVLKAHVFIYSGSILILAILREFEKVASRYLDRIKYHKWTERVWAIEDIAEWTQIIKKYNAKIQTQKEINDRQTFFINVEKNTPVILFFQKLQQEINRKNKKVAHKMISLLEEDEDIYNFQRKLLGESQDIGELIEQGLNEDPIAAQNKIFQDKLAELVLQQEKKGTDLHIYIENYNNLSQRTREQLEAFLSEQTLATSPSRIFIIATKIQTEEDAQMVVPALEWERIKELSSDYISEEIIEWVEKEAQAEQKDDSVDFNGTITLHYLLQKIEYLIWYHNKDIQDTEPGIGNPMDVIRKGLSEHIVTKSTEAKSRDDYKNIVSNLGTTSTSKAILLYEFFRHSINKGEVTLSIKNIDTLQNYISSETDEYLMIPYTSLLYTIKKILDIHGACTVKEVLTSLYKTPSRPDKDKIIKEFQSIRNSKKIQSQLTKIFIEALIEPKSKELEQSFKTVASYYEKLQNKKAIQQLIILGEYLFPNSDLVLDMQVQKQIVHLTLNTPNKERKRAFSILLDKLEEESSHKIELSTWHEFFALFVRNNPPLSNEEAKVLAKLNEIYAKHLKEPTSIYSDNKSNVYYQYQIAYHQILLQKTPARPKRAQNPTQEEREAFDLQQKEFLQKQEDFIDAMQELIEEIQNKSTSSISKDEQKDLRLVTIHIRNKLFRTMMGSKQSNIDELIEKTQQLIQDREELQKEKLDFDYALMRDIYAFVKKDDAQAFTYALKALSVTVSSMKIAIQEQDFVQKDKDGHDTLMAVSRLAGLYIGGSQSLHPTIDKYFTPEIYSSIIDLLFPNRPSDEEKWDALSTKDFILHCCHAICNKESFGAPFFFSKKYRQVYLHQAFAYIYLIDPQYPLEIKEASIASEIKHKLHMGNWRSSGPWFNSPQGIIAHYQKDHSESFIEEFDQFIDSKSKF